MKNLIKYSGLFVALLAVTSCENFLDLRYTNDLTEETLDVKPRQMIGGLCMFGYTSNTWFRGGTGGCYMDCLTDNAVSRTEGSNQDKAVFSSSTYLNNTTNMLDRWSTYYECIRAINDFFERTDKESFDFYPGNPARTAQYLQRTKGEGYFMRAVNHFELLRRHAGIDASGELMGIPIMKKTMSADKVEYLTRNTYKECVDAIVADLDTAIDSLPFFYDNNEQNGLSPFFCGPGEVGRATALAAAAIKSRVLLYAASPLYNGTEEDWKAAAAAGQEAIQIIVDHGDGFKLPDVYDITNLGKSGGDGLSGLYSFAPDNVSPEVIMPLIDNSPAGPYGYRDLPPGVKFKGQAIHNPTQNLVDAFPMANGYPITESASGYDRNKMYVNRDPRFYMTVLYNKQKLRGNEIQAYAGGADMSGATGVTSDGTRTGYFLRKWVSSKDDPVVKPAITDYYPTAWLRRVELYLNFAEAANEVGGPDDKTYGWSAREVMAEIRRRAGITSDAYMNTLTSKEAFREFIHNERRIELCFEDQYYFDVRRWKAKLSGIEIKGIKFADANDNVGTIETISTTVNESGKAVTAFEDYMYFSPIPNKEVLTTGGTLTQNAGWEN